MAHELILTSVSQGLEPDSRGFCAVAADREISPYLVQHLMALSDYRHPFLPNTENAPLNPIAYSHVIVPSPTGNWSVLSRISDAGVDIRNNPNRLAHHIALLKDEQVKEGPAWLLALPGFHVTQWFTPPVRFEQCRPLPTLTVLPPLTRRQCIARQSAWHDPLKVSLTVPITEYPDTYREWVKRNEEQIFMAAPPSSPCPSWQELVGDAGWAGVLAETVRTGQPVVVVYNPGLNILPLFVESLALLPETLLWKGTFCTYFTHLPEQGLCQWKGILADTPEAEACLATPNALVLDLTQPLGPAQDGPYVGYARYGTQDLIPNDENLFAKLETDSDEQSDDTVVLSSRVGLNSTTKTEMPNMLPSGPNESSPPPESATGPPILPDNTFTIQPRTRPKRPGPIAFLLTMKSRWGFYLLYGTTMLFVLILLVLVLDQFADFGAVRWLRGDYSQAKIGDKSNASEHGSDKTPISPLDSESVERERSRLREQEQRQLEEEQRKQQEIVEAEFAAQRDAEEKRQKAVDSLRLLLPDMPLPESLPLKVPGIVESEIIPPHSPQLFTKLSALYQYGSALKLNLYPLLDQPNIRVETRKHQLEWDVVAIDTSTSNETLMFQLQLTEKGLLFNWALPGMKPPHFFDTLWTSLGFLRISVEEAQKKEGEDVAEGEESPIRSISLFRPESTPTIVLSKDFVEPDFADKVIETPFAEEPWKTLFKEYTNPPLMFRLEAKIVPEADPDIKGIEYPKGVPSKVVANVQTKTDARRPTQEGSASYESVVISFQGNVIAFDSIVWSDGFQDRDRNLRTEQEQADARHDDIEKQIADIAKKLFSLSGGKLTKETEHLPQQRDELQRESIQQKNRIEAIKDILEKLSSAHDSILKNPRLRFDYSVYLEPVRPQGGDSPHRVPRLENEKSLLILKSVPSPTERLVQEKHEEHFEKGH